MPPDGFSFEDALKPVEAEGFSFADALKPAKKPAKDDLPWDVPMTGAQMRQSQEQIRKGEEKIAANEPGPGLEHLLTGPFRIAQRGGQQLLGERPLPTGVEALEEASLGVRPSKFVSATERPPATGARIEPTVPGGPPAPPPGFTLQEAGITPTPEPPAPGAPAAPKPGSATLEEAGIRPTPEPTPEPAAESETILVPQADGTVKQVQVKTGEPPPPSEPPAPPTTEAPTAPMNPADLRAGFPELSDEQFEALFQQANREVPRPTSTEPADQTAWMKAVMGTMARLSGAAASATPPAADPWVPVAVAPLDQPEAETPISSETTAAPANQPEVATAPMTPARPEEVPASGLKAGDKVMLGDTEHEVEAVRPWTGDQVAVKLKDDPKLHIGAADAPVQKAPSPEAVLAAEPIPAPLTNLEGIHNGPWKAVGKNYIGDTVFENANGVRAIMDSNVPYTESTTEHPEKGRVPKNADDRKRQFLIEGEKWADEKPAAKPRKPQSAKSPDQLANSPTQTTTAKKPKPTAAATQSPEPETPPQSGADIPKGRDLRDAAKQADASKAPDASGKSEIKPEQAEKPPAPGLPTPKTATVADLPASAPKPKREYDARLTKPGELAANKLAVDALNGDITEKEAVSGLAKMVRDGVIPEGVARVNLGRLTDWNEGDWEAAKAPTKPTDTDKPPPIKGFHATSEPFADFDWNRLGRETKRNITDADDPLSFGMALAKLGPWAHENAISEKLARTHDLPVEIGGRGKNYRSLEALHKEIVKTGGAEKLRNSLVSQGFGHIKVKDEEFGGTSYVGLAPEHFSIAAPAPTPEEAFAAADAAYKTQFNLYQQAKRDHLDGKISDDEYFAIYGEHARLRDAVDAAQDAIPDEDQRAEQRRIDAGIEEVALTDAYSQADDKALEPQMDDIREMLKNGWSPGDIALQPGIDRTSREIRALQFMWREDGQLPQEAAAAEQPELPLTQKEKYAALYPADTPAATGVSPTEELNASAQTPTSEADGTSIPAGTGPAAGGVGQPAGGRVRAPRSGSRSGGRSGRDPGLAPSPAGNVPAPESSGDPGEAGVRPQSNLPGSNEPLPDGGNAADGRPGTGGSGVDDAGTGAGPKPVVPELDLSDPGEIQPPTIKGVDVDVSAADVRPNFFISDPEAMVGGGAKQRFNRNRRAIQAFRAIEEEGRQPTEAELADMAGFTGWGSFGQDLFQGTFERPIPRKDWDVEGQWLREHLGPEAWRSAQASIRNAHYTDPPTVQAMWNMVRQMGFKGGRVLEPSVGIGNFFGLMPRDLMSKSTLTGIELEPTTGGMAQLLYPRAGVFIKGFQESQTPDNFYDLVIGNWPFDTVGPADRRYNRLNPTLHDYFYLKALDQTRPGGLVVGITSAGTMDKMDRMARMEMAKKGELIASFRLPTGAFEQYAGTKVVTDIIILRKRSEPLTDAAAEPWMQTKEMQTPEGKIRVNQYYHDHPENVLGTFGFGSGTTTFREGMLVHRPANLMERLGSLPAQVPANAYTPVSRGSEPRFITNNSLDRKGSVVIGEDGNLYQVAGERMVRLDDVHKPMKAGSARAQQRRLDQIKALVPMRKAYGALIDAERDNADAAPALREALRDLYTQFVESNPGKMIDTDGMKVLDKVGDPGWPILAALQRPDGSPAAILSGPVVRGKRATDNPSVSDAYVMVRNESLNLDMDRIAELVRVPVEQVEKTLLDSGAIYRTPGGGFEPSDSYLSGNTRRKLREAEDAVQRGEPMEASVEALKKAVPANTPYYEIEAKLGAPWVSNKDYQQFIAENLLDLPEDRWPEVEVRFTGGRWSVTLPSRLTETVEATQTHGHPRYRFDRLLTAAMGNVTPRIMDPADREGGPYYNAKASEEVATRIQEVREKFQDWAWRDAARTVRLEDAFNQSMNAITKPHYDGSFMDMSGMALTRGDDPFDLRRHQINAIWRGVALGRGLFAHEVGTGKTYTIGGIAIEGRRYGKWNKPLLLAHNANSRAVATEIQQMYPGAKILFLSSEDLTPKTLKQSMYTIRNEDWDLVVMQHSHLDRMALKRETLMGLAREQITAVEDEMNAAAEEDNENLDRVNLNDLADIEKKIRSVTAKNLAKTRLSILSNIEKQAQRASREGAVPFEDLGVDALFVDEAHEFKKPPIATRMNVKGLNTKTSERSIALNFLTQYVKNNNNGNGVFLFTGTPVTNSLNEIFNISRYFMDDVMKREGIADWDTWFNTFADALNDVELVTTGDYESIKRLSSFVNVDELVRVMSQFTDVVQAKDMPEFVDRATETGKTLGSPGLTPEERDFLENGRTENPTGRPYKRVINDVVEIPSDQATILAQLREEAQAFKRASARYRRDNKHIPLVIDTEVGNASLDARLYDTEAVDNPNSKVNRVTKNVLEIYKTPKTAQMIFFDKGYNPSKRNPNFNMIDDLIDKLVKGGIPRNEIAIVAGDLKPEQKQAIAKAMNTSKLRVAIGQSGTLGVGVNAQDNLRAMHHMDAPWRPGDLEQRNGRGHRQGNSWNTVLEYRYITEGIDGRRWQVLTIKDRFIKQFIGAFNDESGKRIGVIEGDAADISEKEDIMGTLSAAAGDPRLMQKEKLKADVTRLERRERTHTYGIADAVRRIAMLRQQIVARGRQKADIEQSLNAWNDAQTRMEAAAAEAGSKNRWYEANVDGQELRTSADIQDAFDKQVLLLAQGEGEVKIGTINGLGIAAEWRKGQTEPYYHLTDAKGDTVGETMTGLTVQRIIGQLTKQKNYLDNVEAWNRIDLEDIPKLEKAAQQPFTQAVPLLKKRQQLANLEDDLQENPVPPPAWLRHGAAIDTPIWVDGKERLVRGHRMKDDYYIVTDEGDVPYMRVTDKNGFNVYVMRPPPPAPPPKDLPAWAPPLIAKTPGAAVIWHRGDLVLVRAEEYGEEVFLGFKKGLTDDQQAWDVYGMRGAFDVKDIDKMRSEAESWRDRERNRKALEQSRQPKTEPPPPPAPSETPWVGLGGVDPLTRRLLAERESRDAARTRELAAKWIQRQTPGKPN